MIRVMENRVNDTRRFHEMPHFSGRPEEWPRLQKSLTGEARKVVASMLINPRHVGQVMETLQMTFGRPELLVRSQVNIVRNLPSIHESHLEQLGPFATSVRNLATFLDSDATRQYLADPTLLDELTSKLPMSRRLDWAAASMQILPCPTIKDFSQWLDRIAWLVNLCKIHPTTSRNVNRAAPEQSTNRKTPYTGDKHVLLSAIGAKAHDIRGCEEFLRLSAEDRWKEVSQLPLCYCCLKPDQLLPACNNKKNMRRRRLPPMA